MEYLPVPYKQDSGIPQDESDLKSPRKMSLLRFFAYLICIIFALSALLFSAVSAANGITDDGGALDYIINDIFGGIKTNENIDPLSSLLLQNFGMSLPSREKEDADSNEISLPRPPDTSIENESPPILLPTPEQLYEFDYSLVPENENAIVPINLSIPAIRLNNETSYSPDIESIGAPTNHEISSEPLVLILHTHATEAFSEEGKISYTDTDNVPRSSDKEKNIVSVGAVMADILNEAGVPTLHCDTLHDEQSYKDSYQRASETIKSYLEEYPSIKYVFDVHRDSIIASDGTKYRPITIVDEKLTAQVMVVVGTDDKGAEHPDWQENLKLAVALENDILDTAPGMARAINLRGAAFNQQYTSGSLLLEIGSCGNTLEEAKNAAVKVAESLAKIIKGE